jgi:hypothetical protein
MHTIIHSVICRKPYSQWTDMNMQFQSFYLSVWAYRQISNTGRFFFSYFWPRNPCPITCVLKEIHWRGDMIKLTTYIKVNSAFHLKKPPLGASAKVASSYLSVLPYGTRRLPLDGFSGIWYFRVFRKSVEKFQVSLKSDEDTLHEDRCKFKIEWRWILLSVEVVSEESSKEKQNTLFFFENIFVCETMRKNSTAGQST